MHHNDNKMIEIFNQKKDLLHELFVLFENDKGIISLFKDWSNPPDLSLAGIKKDREIKYREIMEKIGLIGLEREQNAYYFIVTTEGMLDSGSYKGFAYLPVNPANTYNSLDVRKNIDATQKILYKKLSGKWYIYIYETED
ncbi:MAG: hypothetical protein GY754_29375 [bacterium]|nr:hypothetical protein [bacterium]